MNGSLPEQGGGSRRAQRWAAATVLALALVLAAIALARSQPRLAGTTNVGAQRVVALVVPGRTVCQRDLVAPAGTAGARVTVRTAGKPPPLRVTLEAPGARLRAGSVAGYPSGSSPLVRFRPLGKTIEGARVCVRVDRGRVGLAGGPSAGHSLLVGGHPRSAQVQVALVRAGSESLLGVVPAAFHRAALFRPGFVGPWTYWLLAALTLALVVACPLLLLRWRARPPAGLTRAALILAAFGFLNAAVWSLVTPAFQPPDEAAHYAYVASLVERGRVPSTERIRGETPYTGEEQEAVDRTAVGVVQNPAGRPPWTELQEQQVADAIADLGSRARAGGGGLTAASAYPPSYYALEAVPYAAGRDSTIWTRIWLMRLLSALMAAGSVALAFLFVREMLPSVPWAAPAAALAVACEPMFAFIGGAVNNDSLLILLATALLYLLARVLQRGLDVRLALATGLVLGLGIAAKPHMYAFLPLAVATLGYAAWRQRSGARALGLQAVAFVAPLAALVVLRYVTAGLPLFDEGAGIEGATLRGTGQGEPFSAGQFASYLWQWFLPHLGFMTDWFPFLAGPPVYRVFFVGFWADFGHLDTKFPGWVYVLLLVASVAALGAAAAVVWRERARLGQIWPRLALAALAVVGLALLVILRSYLARIGNGLPQAFAQGRYLLPVVAIFGLTLAVAALAAGRERGIVVATAFVTALAALNAFALGLVVVRFFT